MATLLIVLLVLVILALLSTCALLCFRYRRRRSQVDELSLYEESRTSRHRRITARPSRSIYVYQEKQNLLDSSDAPPSASVPEIRITFPDEADVAGKRQSGRVVVVHVGETSTGLEPYEEKLPPYQQSEGDRFESLDLDRIGGLKEKDVEAQWR